MGSYLDAIRVSEDRHCPMVQYSQRHHYYLLSFLFNPTGCEAVSSKPCWGGSRGAYISANSHKVQPAASFLGVLILCAVSKTTTTTTTTTD